MPTLVIPFNDNILLDAIEAKKTTEAGLVIPENYQHQPPQGKVIDKGPSVSDQIKLGDILFYPHAAESSMDYKGRKFKMIGEQSVLGCIREMSDADLASYKAEQAARG